MFYLIYIISKYIILHSIDILSVDVNIENWTTPGYCTNVMFKLMLLKRPPT